MRKHWLAALVLMISLATAPALLADHGQGKGKDHDKEHGNPHAAKYDDDHHGWEVRNGYEYHVFQGHPPGWSKGKKTGWGNCGMPPGQAKKYGCYAYQYQGRTHYYYQEDDGRVVVRRPVVAIHGSVDIVK